MYVLWLGIMLMAGLVIGFFAKKMMTSRAIRLAQQKAEALLNEAKQEAKDIMLDAKDKALKIIEEAKTEEKERRIQLNELGDRLAKRETLFDKKLLELEDDKQKITQTNHHLAKTREEINKIKEEQLAKL